MQTEGVMVLILLAVFVSAEHAEDCRAAFTVSGGTQIEYRFDAKLDDFLRGLIRRREKETKVSCIEVRSKTDSICSASHFSPRGCKGEARERQGRSKRDENLLKKTKHGSIQERRAD